MDKWSGDAKAVSREKKSWHFGKERRSLLERTYELLISSYFSDSRCTMYIMREECFSSTYGG